MSAGKEERGDSHGSRRPGGDSGQGSDARGSGQRRGGAPSTRGRGDRPGTRAPRRRPDAARVAAFECLEAVEDEGGYANLVMPRILAHHRLAGRDAAFATELAYGALRQRALYEAIIERASGRSVRRLDPPVRRALVLGCHQVLGMRVADHAAVGETVTLARAVAGEGPAKLVNAVLRRVTEADRDAWLARVAPGSGRDALAVRHSHPAWVVGELEKALAADGRRGEVESLLEADNAAAAVSLVARPGLVDRAALIDSAEGAVAGELAPTAVIMRGGGDPGAIEAVRRRAAAVQDEGSQLVAAALVAARPVVPGERWLDLCAGPGGKAALLGAHAALAGARLDALELHRHRAELVRDSVSAIPEGVVSVSTGDGASWGEGSTYDRIVLDAPCTGLGALRRRPEARWRKSPQDIAELTALQSSLLANAARLIKPGGIVAYITCSPLLSETRDVVARERGLRALDARGAVASMTGTRPEAWGEGPHVQLWTHAHGTDSMFLALLERPVE